MSLYFSKGAAASLESKHYKKNSNAPSKHEQAWSTMPNGLSSFPQSTFPNDKPPTLFHPASPKQTAAKPVKEIDAASMMSTSTFASTISLIKESAKAKLHPKNKNGRKEEMHEQKVPSPRSETAEAYRIIAMTKH